MSHKGYGVRNRYRFCCVEKCFRFGPTQFFSMITVIILLMYATFSFLQSDIYLRKVKTPVLKISGEILAQCCKNKNSDVDICGESNCYWPCIEHSSQLPFISPEQEKAFLHETSGSNALDFRQACAVESLASNNRNLTVYVLMSSENVDWDAKTMQSLKKFNNVNIYSINLGYYFLQTPLEHWYFCTTWNYGPYAVSHLSDALRFLTLYKFGGYYFDLDILMRQSVSAYHNFIGAEDESSLAAGAFHVDYRHPVIRTAVKEFHTTYTKANWGYNGPQLLTRVLKKWCAVDKVMDMTLDNCHGFEILPPTVFYPINWLQWEKYFTDEDVDWDNKTIGMHVWNKKSAEKPVYKNSSQLYSKLARLYCPSTFSVFPDVF